MANTIDREMDEYFVDNILNKPELIVLYTGKLFQVFLSNTNNSIKHQFA